MKKHRFVILTVMIMTAITGKVSAQFVQPCGITFANYIECGASIDFDYWFEDAVQVLQRLVVHVAPYSP